MSIPIGYKNSSGVWTQIGTVPIPPVVTPPPPPTSNLYDNFPDPAYRLNDGQTSANGKWRCLYTGGGIVETRKSSAGGTDNYIYLAPMASTSRNETHGAAVATTKMFKDFDLTLHVKTIKQLRTGSTPNNWETAWLNWCRSDSITDINEMRFHAYAFTLKIDGFQLEKKDNENQDDAAEIYLVTQNAPDVRLNVSQKWRIKVTGTATGTPRIEVWVDDMQIVNYIDNRTPLNSEKMKRQGPIVLYTEDAAVAFDNVFITEL